MWFKSSGIYKEFWDEFFVIGIFLAKNCLSSLQIKFRQETKPQSTINQVCIIPLMQFISFVKDWTDKWIFQSHISLVIMFNTHRAILLVKLSSSICQHFFHFFFHVFVISLTHNMTKVKVRLYWFFKIVEISIHHQTTLHIAFLRMYRCLKSCETTYPMSRKTQVLPTN